MTDQPCKPQKTYRHASMILQVISSERVLRLMDSIRGGYAESSHDLAEAASLPTQSAGQCLRKMAMVGLVDSVRNNQSIGYSLTEFGQKLLDLADAIQSEREGRA